jgi:hypothetical protein
MRARAPPPSAVGRDFGVGVPIRRPSVVLPAVSQTRKGGVPWSADSSSDRVQLRLGSSHWPAAGSPVLLPRCLGLSPNRCSKAPWRGMRARRPSCLPSRWLRAAPAGATRILATVTTPLSKVPLNLRAVSPVVCPPVRRGTIPAGSSMSSENAAGAAAVVIGVAAPNNRLSGPARRRLLSLNVGRS